MLGLLRAILDALRNLRRGQDELTLQMEAQIAALRADLTDQFTATDAMIEHLRELIEGDDIPVNVGAPTFTPTGGNQ